MNNYYRFKEPYSYEYFELSLNIDDSRLSSKELRSYLFQFEKLVDSINQTLRYHSSEESYDKISIDVLAIEHGSFRIPLLFKKGNLEKIKNQLKDLTNNPTAAIIIGEIVVHLLISGLNKPVDVPPVQEPHRIENVFLENPDTVKAIKRISKMAIDNDSVRDLTVVYENGKGEKERIEISKTVLRETFEYMENVMEYEEKREVLSNTSSIQETNELIGGALGYDEKCEVFNDETIEIISVYDGVKPLLHCKFREGVLYAEIHDTRCSKARIISLQKGDRIRVDMVALGRGKNKKYYITRVWM